MFVYLIVRRIMQQQKVRNGFAPSAVSDGGRAPGGTHHMEDSDKDLDSGFMSYR